MSSIMIWLLQIIIAMMGFSHPVQVDHGLFPQSNFHYYDYNFNEPCTNPEDFPGPCQGWLEMTKGTESGRQVLTISIYQ